MTTSDFLYTLPLLFLSKSLFLSSAYLCDPFSFRYLSQTRAGYRAILLRTETHIRYTLPHAHPQTSLFSLSFETPCRIVASGRIQ